MGRKVLKNAKGTSLQTKNTIKAQQQQKRPKMEERRAFENLSAHFGCAENFPSNRKRTVLQMNCNL
jgi:hypothetical protein